MATIKDVNARKKKLAAAIVLPKYQKEFVALLW